jgi:hypothetical protein
MGDEGRRGAGGATGGGGGGPLAAPDARHVDAERAGAAAVGADVLLGEGEPRGVPVEQRRRRLPSIAAAGSRRRHRASGWGSRPFIYIRFNKRVSPPQWWGGGDGVRWGLRSGQGWTGQWDLHSDGYVLGGGERENRLADQGSGREVQ